MTRTVANTDIAGTAALLMSRFSGRPDVYLVEQYGRTWTEKKPLTDNVLISHIKGERRVGRFPIEHGRTTWVCWDFDCQDPEMVKPLVNLCAKWGLPVTVERSREKGYHVWLLLSEPVPAAMAREVGLTLMRAAGLECEVFPKQDDLNANEFGNAVFLPWQGISVTKNRTVFIDPQTLETYTDQVSHLRFHERLSTEWFEYVSDLCRPGVEQSPCNPLVEQAISKATNGTRNDIGFELACSLRDDGLPQCDAAPLILRYEKAVGNRGIPPYTEGEALASLRSAYSKPARTIATSSGHQSIAEKLVDLASANAEFFHTPENVAYALISNDAHSEVWQLKCKHFKQWLAQKFFKQYGKVPNATSIGDAILALEGQALFSGYEANIHVRVTDYQGKIIIDLCNEEWECIVVDPSGWRIVQNAPVKFRRSRGMLALPRPILGGSLEELRQFINLSSKEEWCLLVVWLLYVLKGHGPYLMLVIQGEQGAGKTTAVRILHAILDPNISPVRSEPKEIRDLLISATNSYLQAFDNLSSIVSFLSDALCRLLTGGGFATRELYTDQEEVILDAVRPLIVNGIESLPSRSDLLDRTIFMTLPTIGEGARRSEVEVLEKFEAVRPQIFGALLTALSKALRELPSVKVDRLPRMADFGIFGVAVERALGWPSGTFLKAYETNRMEAHSIAIEASAIAGPIEDLMSANREWDGTATDLLETLNGIASFEVKRRRGWPATARQLANQLTRLAPNLRTIGITVNKDRKGHAGTRMIYLQREDETNDLKECNALARSLAKSDKGNGVKTITKKEDNSSTHPKLKELSESWKPVKPPKMKGGK